MPGLIHHSDYQTSKDAACSASNGIAEAIEALEWMLLLATAIGAFPSIRPLSRVHYANTDPSPHSPSAVILFVEETHDGVVKWLLLDVFESKSDE
jgi:hypothetical protein